MEMARRPHPAGRPAGPRRLEKMQQVSAYLETKQQIVDPRQSESLIFRRVTDQLKDVAEAERRDEMYHRAVLDNRRLWTALAADVSDPSNMLPDELKSNLLSLAIWVERESGAAHSGGADIRSMIEINEAIIAGLNARQ
jgi:flagellar protein FlaF